MTQLERKLNQIDQKLDRLIALAKTTIKGEVFILANIDEVLASIEEMPSINDSLDALFLKLQDLIVAGNSNPAKLQQALDLLTTNKDRTKAAIVANTPVDPVPPVTG